jgi:signal transduction histidine kinase
MQTERDSRLRLDAFGVWLAIALVALVFGLGIRSTIILVDDTKWIDHTHRVIEVIADFEIHTARLVAARREFALTGDLAEAANFRQSELGCALAILELRILTADNPAQQRRLNELAPALASYIVRWNLAIADRRARGFDAGREAVEFLYGAKAFVDLSSRIDELVAEEERLLVTRELRTTHSLTRTRILQAVGTCFGLGLLAIVVIRLRREVRRREQSERALQASELANTRLNHELERRIVERTAQLKLSNDELEAFSYSLIHDLRAPLRGMGSFAEVLLEEQRDTLDEGAKDSLGEIQRNARKMATLIDALDAMSRITRCEITYADIDLGEVIRAAAAKLGIGDIVIQTELRAGADRALVQSLIDILVDNSYKFTRNSPMPRIEAGDLQLEGERVLFIRDNGAGFDMAHYEKLFSPFGRLHTVAEFPGTGIGLATARRIVQRHGARIWADGHVGLGATFYFTLAARSK